MDFFSWDTLWYGLLIMYVPACFGLIVIVLLQKGKGTGFAGAFGAGAGPGSRWWRLGLQPGGRPLPNPGKLPPERPEQPSDHRSGRPPLPRPPNWKPGPRGPDRGSHGLPTPPVQRRPKGTVER